MEVEVVVRVPPAADFFNSGSPCSSHYLSAPSTPFSSLSAPTSPSHAFNFFRLDDDAPVGSPSAVPFHWEEKPGLPKSPKFSSADHNFEFDFTPHQFLTKASLSADELFHAGKIKPLQPPPGFQSNVSSPRSPHNSRLSPRKTKSVVDMNINDDPFEAALMKETLSHNNNNYELSDNNRGRLRDKISNISSNFVRKPTRSLSPFRISSEIAIDGDGDNSSGADDRKLKSSSSSFLSAISFSRSNRKWRLRDLFRSASEGRATEKPDKLRSTYVVMSEKMDDDVKISSFRSADSGGSRMHFTAANKNSFLPNRPGFLGRCLRFNRSGVQGISKDIGSLTRG